MNKPNTEVQEITNSTEEHSDSWTKRRRFVRAGLAAAPVILTVASKSVLAGDICIKTSAFSSLAAAGNTGVRGNLLVSNHTATSSYTCYSHGHWKHTLHPAPYSATATSFFRTNITTTVLIPEGAVFAGFEVPTGHALFNHTLVEILNEQGNVGNDIDLARHLVATFLTATAFPGDGILTADQCRAMWANRGGSWTTPSGATWNKTQMMDYFNYIYGR